MTTTASGNDAYYACLEKCLFEPLFGDYSNCYKLDLACACGNGLWDNIYGCVSGACGSYSASISASAISYCSVASEIPLLGSASVRTVTAVATASGGSNGYSTVTDTETTTITSLPGGAASQGRTVTVTASALPGSNTGNSSLPDVSCDTSLGTGAVAGIAVGCLLIGVATALVAACLFFRRRNKKSRQEYPPEISQASTAYRSGGTGPAASPLLASPHNDMSVYSNQATHGTPTVLNTGVNDTRLGSPAPSYRPVQQFSSPYQAQQKDIGVMHNEQGVVEHDGRERGWWQHK